MDIATTSKLFALLFFIALGSNPFVAALTWSSSTVKSIVIENCFDDDDDDDDNEGMPGWLEENPVTTAGGRSSSVQLRISLMPCGNVSAIVDRIDVPIRERSSSLTPAILVTYELAIRLQTILAAATATRPKSVNYVAPERWLLGRPSSTSVRSPSESASASADDHVPSGVLYAVTSTNSAERGKDDPCQGHKDEDVDVDVLSSRKFLLKSLLRFADRLDADNGGHKRPPDTITVYLYHGDRTTMKTSTSFGSRQRRSHLAVGHDPARSIRRPQDDRGFVPVDDKSYPHRIRGTFSVHHLDRQELSKSYFRIGIIEFPPFMMIKRSGPNNETVEYSGVLMDIIRVLASRLNFNYTLVQFRLYGSKARNGTWIGAVGAVVNKDVDLVVADMSITPQRLAVVDYSIPYLQGSQGVVIRRAMEQPSIGDLLRTHLRPFHWTIWLVIGASLLLSTALLTHASREEPTTLSVTTTTTTATTGAIQHVAGARRNQTAPQRLPTNAMSESWSSSSSETRIGGETWWSVMFQMLGIFCQQGCALSPTRTSGRVILYTVCLTSLAVYNFYTSVFISFTTVTKKPVPVNTLSDVLIDPTYQFGFVHLQSSNLEEMFKNSDKKTYRRAWQRMVLQPEAIYMPNIGSGIERAYAEKYAFIDEIYGLQWFVGRNCSLKLLQDRMLVEGYHLIFTKNSTDIVLFNVYLKRLQESGMVGRFMSNHMPQMTADFCMDVNALEAVGLDRMAGLFICLLAGIVLTSISVVLEKLDSRPLVSVERPNRTRLANAATAVAAAATNGAAPGVGAATKKVIIKVKKY